MRINIIPPKELYDQHLMAEIREIKMLPKALVRSLKSKHGVDYKTLNKEFPKYTLNKGHGKFFYNKIGYIENRFQDLLKEANSRGFTLQPKTKKLYDITYDYSILNEYRNNPFINICQEYTPTEAEKDINKERIQVRLSEKPNFYKYYGKNVNAKVLSVNIKECSDKIIKHKEQKLFIEDIKAELVYEEYLKEKR